MKTQPSRPRSTKVLIFCGLLATVLVLFTGCVVTAVYPYYTAKDVIFDPALVGVWIDSNKTNSNEEAWSFEKIDDKTYKLIVVDKDKKTEFDARLFNLKGQRFLDCLERARPDNTIPVHFLMKVEGIEPALELRLLDYGWLGKLIEKNPKAIRHTIVPKKAGESGEGGLLVLTADTAELQKFILKHLKTKEAWTDASAMKRR